MARVHDEAEVERIALAGFCALDAPTEAKQSTGKGKWVDETAVVAALIRKRAAMRNRWVAERLGMGHEGNVTRAIRSEWMPGVEIQTREPRSNDC